MVETQFNKKIKILRTDNETGYVNQNFINFLNKKALFTKLHASTHLNKMVCQNEKSSSS
jgi:hypothetical protein